MKAKNLVIMASALIVSSLILFALHFLIFEDLHHILIYTIHDIAFLPIEVLIVSVFLHRIIESSQKKQMLEKMNMAVGMFFSEGGTRLLSLIVHLDKDAEEISGKLLIRTNWTKQDYKTAIEEVEKLEGGLNLSRDNLNEMESLLSSKRDFILRLLENPNLMEHEAFTDLLWAVFHLTEELIARKEHSELPENDIKHLDIDIMRAYKLLVREWLRYMENMQKNYPYLFSMAVRTNPLNRNSTPIFS